MKVRMIVRYGDKIKKLPNRMMDYIPRVDETILWDGRDFKILNVNWDFELRDLEVCLELCEIQSRLNKGEW